MSTTPITDHTARAQANLLAQFDGSPRLRALVGVLVDGAQLAEDVLQEILAETTLDAAAGVQLDRIYGEVADQLRSFMSDDEYRLVLEARGYADRSRAEVETILTIATLLFGVAIMYRQNGRASYSLEWTLPGSGSGVEYAQLAGRILGQATGAGISYQYTEGDDPDALVLGVGPALGTGILGRLIGSSNPGLEAP